MTNNAVLAPLLARVCRTHHWQRTTGNPVHYNAPLTDEHVSQHLNGGVAIGACPITPGESTTRLALLDLDNHKGDVPWEGMIQTAQDIIEALAEAGVHAIPFRSSGGGGIHLYMLWKTPQDCYSVREMLRMTLAKCAMVSGTGGVSKGEVEIFPKQDAVPASGFGSMFILPLNNKSCALYAERDLIDTVPGNIEWKGSDDVTVREKPVAERITTDVDDSLAMVKSALDAIPNTGTEELDYDQWRNVVFALHSATGGSSDGLSLAHDFSSRSGKYSPDFLDHNVWPHIKDRADGITVRSLYSMASRFGWVDPTLADAFPVLPPESGPLPPLNQGVLQTAGGNPFETISIDEFTSGTPPPWIVKDVLPKAALGLIIGESTSGKTFFALDIVGAVARGAGWRDKRVDQGRVVYICAEGIGGFRNRVRAYAATHDDPTGPAIDLRIIPNAPNFMEADDIKAVIASVMACGPCSIIVVDTMARVMPGANENAGEDMGKVLFHCAQLHRVTGALVLLIHHTGKDATKGARGHSSLKAAADCEIEITRNGHDRVATVTKLKDGEDGAEFGFKLRVVEVGLDADNEMVTSCVVEASDAMPKADRAKLNKKLGVNEQHLFDIASARQDRSEDLTETAVKAEAVAALSNDEHDKKNNQRDMNRAWTALVAKGRFVVASDGRTFSIFGRDSLA